AVVGNSSGALIEAPAVGAPTVNIGDRQKGRIRAKSVLECEAKSEAIVGAIKAALTNEFRDIAKAAGSPFGDGRSGERIVEILRTWKPPVPPVKQFFDNH